MLRPVFIAFLLVITLFPFYYMVMLSFRPLDAVLQDPGALFPQLGEIDLGTYRDVLAPVEDGGQGFLNFIKNSFLVAIGTVVLTPARVDPRRVRRQPAGVLRSPPDRRGVPRRLLLPGDPAGDPAVRVLHPHPAARQPHSP